MLFQNLKNFLESIPSKYILLVIVIFGFLLRVNNLTIGFPMLYVSNDEAIYHLSALNMLAEKTPFTLGNYGPLGAYIQIPFLFLSYLTLQLVGKVSSITDMEFLLLTQEGYLLFVPRVISAMFGTLSILLVYKLSINLSKSRSVALWSAFLFAVSFNMVHISHLARGWAPAIFFCLLAVRLAHLASFVDENKLKNTLAAFFFAAIAFGFHQMSGIVIILLFLISFMSSKKVSSDFYARSLLSMILFLSIAAVFNFLSLGKDFLKVIEPANPTVGLINIPPISGGLISFIQFYAGRGVVDIPKNLLLSDGLIVVFALFFFLSERSGKYLPYILFFVFNFLLLVTVFPYFLRYFLISLAFIPLFSGLFMGQISGRVSKFLIVIFICVFSFNSVYWNFLLLRKSTFDELRAWLNINISPQTPIAAPNKRNLGYVPSFTALNLFRENNSQYYLKASKLVGDTYPYNVRNIVYFDEFKSGSKVQNLEIAIRMYPINYVIDWYMLERDRLINKDSEVKLRPVASFSPTGKAAEEYNAPEILTDAGFAVPLFKVTRAGPYFDVFEVIN